MRSRGEFALAHAETQILRVAKARFDGPTFAVERDDLRGRERAVAGGQRLGLLHAARLRAHHRADLTPSGSSAFRCDRQASSKSLRWFFSLIAATEMPPVFP